MHYGQGTILGIILIPNYYIRISIKGHEVGNNIHNLWHMFMVDANQNKKGTSPSNNATRGLYLSHAAT